MSYLNRSINRFSFILILTMVRKFRNKIGFTLIEVIVTLVIIGVLSAMALPSIFSWIERSRIGELVPELKDIANQMDACVFAKGLSNIGGCLTSINQNNLSTTHFSLASSGAVSPPIGGGYAFFFVRNNIDSGYQNSASETLSCSGQAGMSTTTGTSPMIAICGWPQDGTSTDPNAGTRKIVGSGVYKSLF